MSPDQVAKPSLREPQGCAVDFGTCLNDKNPDRGALLGGRVKRRCPRLWSTHQSTP